MRVTGINRNKGIISTVTVITALLFLFWGTEPHGHRCEPGTPYTIRAGSIRLRSQREWEPINEL